MGSGTGGAGESEGTRGGGAAREAGRLGGGAERISRSEDESAASSCGLAWSCWGMEGLLLTHS